MANFKLEALKNNSAFLALFNEGMSALYRSGVLDILRDNGRIVPVSPETPNYVDYQAALANWSIGYNTALDQLIHFREIFLDDKQHATPEASFGSLELAVSKGDLTQEEADAIRSNSTSKSTIKPSSGGSGSTK